MMLLAACSLLACGRGPVPELASFRVVAVDRADNPLPRCEVALQHGARVLASHRTDADGMATFRWPGFGSYRLHAQNDPRCCIGEGALDIVLSEPDELFVVEVVIGPCPTWSPPGC